VADVDPMIRVKNLDEAQVTAIHNAIHSVMVEVMAGAGSTNYKDTVDHAGSYQFRVYQQKTAPDGRVVKKTTLAGRSIYHV
jgi:formamidopyrimidine-DNA glycosylase